MAYALIVDDDPVVRHLTARILQAAGYRVAECSTGDEALACLSAIDAAGDTVPAPDVVVSDVTMPGATDGIELVRRLAAVLPALPVILMSGSAGALESARGMTGCVAFLEKPYCAVDLLDLVRAAVG